MLPAFVHFAIYITASSHFKSIRLIDWRWPFFFFFQFEMLIWWDASSKISDQAMGHFFDDGFIIRCGPHMDSEKVEFRDGPISHWQANLNRPIALGDPKYTRRWILPNADSTTRPAASGDMKGTKSATWKGGPLRRGWGGINEEGSRWWLVSQRIDGLRLGVGGKKVWGHVSEWVPVS